jgi:hypothetical protein
VKIARSDFGSIKKMAEAFGKSVGIRASNERSTQISAFKKIWLTGNSPCHLVKYVTRTELKKKDRPMQVSAEVVASGLTTVKAVRKCLKSPDMYLNPAIYNLLCTGLESGKMKQSVRQNKSSLRLLTTAAHEAHIRLELFLSLGEQKYFHDPSLEHGLQRIRMWNKLCDIVVSDREQHAAQAEQTRLGAAAFQDGGSSGDSDDEDDETANPLVNKKYY